jgi:DNA polymerase V
MTAQPQYLCIDLKSFYASVACVDRGLDPLKTRLVVADKNRTDKTICLAVSPALKALGIPGRPRLFEVRQRLNHLSRCTGQTIPFIIAPPQMAHYIQVSADIYAVYLRYIAPEDIHVYSIDEVFIDVTPYLKTYGLTARELAMRIIRDILHATGITATAGIGTNLYLAKIAMDIVAKHVPPDCDGVRIAALNERSYREKLWDYQPLTDFWRIGPGTLQKLHSQRLFTMGDIAARSLADEESLYRHFGVDAEILIDHAWGIEPCTLSDIKHYRPASRSLGAGQVLQRPYHYDEAALILREMTEALVLDLVDQSLLAGGITIDLGYDREAVDTGRYHGAIHIDRYGRRVPKHAHGSTHFDLPTCRSDLILRQTLALYERIANPDLTIKRLTVTANHVSQAKAGSRQLSFFEPLNDDAQDLKLQKTLNTLRKRYGKSAVLKAMDLQKHATALTRNAEIGGHRA